MVYTDVTVEKISPKSTVVNCGPARKIYLDGFADMRYRMVDCMGNEVETGSLKEPSVLTVPGTGMVFAEME